MEIILNKLVLNNVVTITDTTFYEIQRSNYAYILFLNNKKTTGDVNITVPEGILESANNWSFSNLVDGYYKVDFLLIPMFNALIEAAYSSTETISKGTVTYYQGSYYRSLNQVFMFEPGGDDDPYFIDPATNTNDWEEIYSITKVDDVFDRTFSPVEGTGEESFYASLDFVYFNNIIKKYIDVAKIINKCNICASPETETLRCIRDKQEQIELATASSNYTTAQIIIESSENLISNCKC